jgi:hypothetical protein
VSGGLRESCAKWQLLELSISCRSSNGNDRLASTLKCAKVHDSFDTQRHCPFQGDGLGSMLDQWQENLAILAANRAAGDDKVITHLGDCLWRIRGEVAAAHMCYLVADAQPEAFSGTSRVCLIGVDQYKYPRTFATPEGIQVVVTACFTWFRCRARGVFWPLSGATFMWAPQKLVFGGTPGALAAADVC